MVGLVGLVGWLSWLGWVGLVGLVGWVGLGWVGWLGWLAEFLPGWVGCARDADTADQTCDLGSHRRALQQSTFAVEA